MGAVKNAFHDEISNRCPECGVVLSEEDTLPCDTPICPIPLIETAVSYPSNRDVWPPETFAEMEAIRKGETL